MLNWTTMKQSLLQIAMLMMLLAAVFGCNAEPKTSDTDLVQAEFPAIMQWRQDPKVNLVIVDVRSAKAFAAAHISGAVNIPLAELKARDPRLAEANTIVVYASGWNEYISPAAAKKLMALGYQNVYDFRGGMEMWQRYGGPVESANGS